MTHLALLDCITIAPNRQRREHDPLAHQELIASIQYGPVGLQNAPVVRVEGDKYLLVSGERRLRAIREIYELGGTFRYNNTSVDAGMVPFTLVGELNELAAEEAELDENIKRKDLTWQERAAAIARLSDLRSRQAVAEGKPVPTLGDLHEELSTTSTLNRNAVGEMLKLARNLDDPDIAKAASPAEAFKILKRKSAAAEHAATAARVGATLSSQSHQLVLGDAGEWMAGQAEAQFDVILSDPPYGMGADEFGDSGGATAGAHTYNDSYENWKGLMPRLLSGVTRLAKPAAHAYLFCDIERFPELKSLMTALGWDVFRTPLLWFKPSAYRAPWPDAGPQRKYETILYARRGGMKCQKLKGDVLEYPADTNMGHMAQKPVALFQDLLERSATPGMRVLDFCCGSGPIFPAAHALKLYATGLEIDPTAYGMAAKRIEELK